LTDAAPISRPGRRLAVTLALWILPALVLALAGSLWLSATTVTELADSAYDRSLAGAIRAIDTNISTESGGVGVELPYNLFEFFQLTAQGAVYFNVSTDDGLVQIGDVLLPPTTGLTPGQLQFHDARYLGQDIRIGALMRPLDPTDLDGTMITIQVAETKASRTAFQNALIERAILRDLLVVFGTAALLAVGVYAAVKPLRRLRDALDRREPDDLQPIPGTDLPAEVRPLVDAVNRLMQRNLDQAAQQRQFLDDASHQLRTPMAIMRTQIDVALHQDDIGAVRTTLRAVRDVLDRSVRMTNQLLALARAGTAQANADIPAQPFDLGEMLADTVRFLWPRIRSRQQDCAFEPPDGPLRVRANEALLREALTNLIDNAILYAPEHSLITVRLRRDGNRAIVDVLDEGPGMTDEDIAKAGIRFRRGPAGRANGGTGLGLPIALTTARASGGNLRIANRTDRPGLVVSIDLPIA
jgi:two-component system sensor histidine kinase TctE